MLGVYMCGACTHPGGSVIAINGRNAAMAVLADTAVRATHHPFPDRTLRTADLLG
jgi:phytoene dehydrogenase-like protein